MPRSGESRALALGAPPARSLASADGPCFQEELVAVVVNSMTMPATLVLRDAGHRVWVRSVDLARWRFAVPLREPLVRDGEAFLALDGLTGVRHRIDSATQTLHIDTVAGNFVGTVAGNDGARAEASRSTPGAFLNYDVSIQSERRRAGAGGLFEAVAFGSWGSFANSAVARSNLDHGSKAGPGNATLRAGVTRLDSSWTLDRPDAHTSWRAGDLIGRGGSGGAPVRLGGLQYATNFATEPGFVTFPLPSFAGEAAVPSTIDLYIDDALRMRRDVPAGPFSVPNLPVVTGSGEARVVVRDLLGRQQTIVAPFYASARLLRSGLRDFSYEAGALREGYGLRSNDYRQIVALGTERRGFSDTFTGEAHAELARRRQAFGFGAVWLWPAAGVFNATLAASRSTADPRLAVYGAAASARGVLVSGGFEHQSPELNIGGSITASSSGYRPLGRDDSLAPRRASQVYASHTLGAAGSLGVTFVRRSLHDRTQVELLSASWNVTLTRLGQFSVALLRDLRGGETLVGLGFSTVLGADTSLNASSTAQGANHSFAVQAQRSLPAGEGVGYRVMALGGAAARAEAALLLQNDNGRIGLEAAVGQGETAARAGATGAVALLGGHVFASRPIGEGFAVVEVPGFAGVRVYAANQVVGRTNEDGAVLVPRLLPYQRNAIRVEQADLPLDTTIATLEGEVVPTSRGGVLLPIPVRRARGALITALLEDGRGVPVGTVATLAGSPVEFPVGEHGEIYLTGLDATNVVQLVWRMQRCSFDLSLEASADPLPHLGSFVCRGISR